MKACFLRALVAVVLMGISVSPSEAAWKLVLQHLNPAPRQQNPPAPTTELYDLAKDPRAMTDVAAQHPGVVKRLSALAREQHLPSKLWPIRVLDEKF